MTDKPQFVEERGQKVKLNNLCSRGKSSLRQKDVSNDGPYAVYGASGLVGTMASFQNAVPYVAVVKDGAGVGRASACEANTSVLGTMQALIPSEGIDRDYLLHLVRSLHLGDGFSGSTIPHIYFKDYGKLPVRLHSPAEQKRIVDIFASIERQIKVSKQQLDQLDFLVKSRFVEMFGDLKSDTNGWPIKPFETFAIIDTHMANDLTPYLDMPHIGIDSIESGTGRLSGYRTVAEDGIISGKYPFTPEHLIYSKIRPSLNKVALPDFSGVCSSDAYPILPIAGECNRVYLAEVMRSAYFLEYILPLSGRAQMPKVNKKALSGFSMPLPPIELQQQFAAFVAQVDKSRFVAQQQIEKLQMLYDSLAQEYFGD
ncbi:MAG: restriction endonuclease subunit S [Bifidobacterium adolescentis]